MDFEEYTSRVLDAVEEIPAGRVMSYGDLADYLGAGGPRRVGRVLSLHGSAVPWWRVTRADGSPPPAHEQAALRRWRAEGTPLRRDGRGVDMKRARWGG